MGRFVRLLIVFGLENHSNEKPNLYFLIPFVIKSKSVHAP